ncbi:hypothetical protein Ari01nite_73620 [Paractinoplanes rishiriensis]|uniref:Uncharacterized protein n=1 Tax=Paractinoplanes rishiriensis TaxID=1050105 RepID=A0A919K6Y0_9ACTN|nr:hypothetical protein Ari01nite_73620 [Actinoplanes rishiriensis]
MAHQPSGAPMRVAATVATPTADWVSSWAFASQNHQTTENAADAAIDVSIQRTACTPSLDHKIGESRNLLPEARQRRSER